MSRSYLDTEIYIYIYISGKINVGGKRRFAGGTYKAVIYMDILICVDPKFYDTSIGEKIFWFGGQFREL